jgi:hypothetical protein
MTKLLKLFFVFVFATGLSACAWFEYSDNMTTLFDGANLQNWDQVGNADWSLNNGYVEGSGEAGFLVSERPYGDYRLIVEFWADGPANSGVFIRCDDDQTIGADNCYEVNIYDTRPDPTYRTGSIVNVAAPMAQTDAANQWNRFEILAQGSHLEVILNGVETVNTDNDQLDAGYIALQYGSGVVRFREVRIQEL